MQVVFGGSLAGCYSCQKSMNFYKYLKAVWLIIGGSPQVCYQARREYEKFYLFYGL